MKKTRHSNTRPLNRALQLLLRAFHDAEEATRAPEEFAIELSDFRSLGLLLSDLRWLVSKGYSQHLRDSPRARQGSRRLRKTDSLAFDERSCFVLTQAGIDFACKCNVTHHLRQGAKETSTHKAEQLVPRWDGKARELWLGTILVKRHRVRSPNQERILAAFQEDGWIRQIDNPLPTVGESEGKRRLHDAITKLNRHQLSPVIRFRGDGSGNGVCWEHRHA